MFEAVAKMFQQIMAEPEEDAIIAITEIVLKLISKLAARIHRR
jgi:hypothetical protein